MDKALNLQKSLIIFGVPLLIIGLMIVLANSTLFSTNPNQLAIGITFDLLLTAPLVYFLLIRKTKIPKTTVVPFFIIGILIGSYILPLENQYYLNLFITWVFPFIEIAIISYIIYNVKKGIKRYKQNKIEGVDFYTTLKNTCYDLLPKGAAIAVVNEIAVIYYGFINWEKRKLKNNEFSYHKESSTIAILWVIIFLIAIETIVFHILLAKWSYTAAWILTLLSIYSGIQLFGYLKSMFKRPISIENGLVYLRYGIMSETIIDLKNIDYVEISDKDFELNSENRKLSILGDLESQNIIIHLKNANELTGLFGIKRQYRNLALHVDNKIEFKNQIDAIKVL